MKIDIPTLLKDEIRDENVIIFAGAGLSLHQGFPDWKSLVLDFLLSKKEYIAKSEAFSDGLENDIISPLYVLDALTEVKGLFYDYVEERLSLTHDSQSHKLVGEISSKIVTTNFDRFLETNINFSRVTAYTSDYNMSKLLREDSFLFKLHGDVAEIDNCIIFSSQYENMYKNESLATFQLEKLFSDYTVLFIGFSFADPYVKELFEYVGNIYQGFSKKHYLVCTEDPQVPFVTPIILDNYSYLDQLLLDLSDCKKNCNALELKEVGGGASPDFDMVIGTDGCDIAPDIFHWVGREKELNLLSQSNFKVYFITGIGGQGKSSLAAHYLNECADDFEMLLDWKDFKEEDHKFVNKISLMITKVAPDLSCKDLAGLSDDELINLFFVKLGERRAVFVLDNVDSYVDLESLEPVQGIKKLSTAAQEFEHNAQFIFTCRPFIHYAGVEFHQLRLSGISEDDTLEYFRKNDVPLSKDKLKKYSSLSWKLTNGHVLWISLIIAQALRGEENLAKFLKKINSDSCFESNDSSFLAEQMLKNVWLCLKDRDKIVLRTLAESVRAETKDDVLEIVKTELNYNKATKALRALHNLNLLITKKDSDYIELHPLVKEFIRKNYQTSDRSKYITLLINYYDKLILVLKPKLSSDLSFEEFRSFTGKVELYVNKGDFQNAISTLLEIHTAISCAGYIEEFLRVAEFFFSSISWTQKQINSFSNFTQLLEQTIKDAAEFGKQSFVDSLLNRYEPLIENKSDPYIHLCSIRAYLDWFAGDVESALERCQQAKFLLQKANLSDTHDIAHTEALALRGTEVVGNVKKAMKHFSRQYSLEELVDNKTTWDGAHGSVYGNTGKCLQLLGKKEDALNCYAKAYYVTARDNNSNHLINLGYAAQWLSELLLEMEKFTESVYFHLHALSCWDKSSPVLKNQHIGMFDSYKERTDYVSISSNPDWKIEMFCNDWMSRRLEIAS